MKNSWFERIENPLLTQLQKTLIGQRNAISRVVSTIRRKELNWTDKNHPIAFLFMGSSGIGKTELAKEVAKYIHNDNNDGFVRLDMSEYKLEHQVIRLFGAPPSYRGFEDGGQLTNALMKCPNAVVLFDEIEKAHNDVLAPLLQLFDEGRLTDDKGETVTCKDAIFIMTSNLASEEILRFHSEQNSEVTVNQFTQSIIRPILKASFQRDEFIGRINEIIYFTPFSENDLHSFVERQLKTWIDHALTEHKIFINYGPDVIHKLVNSYNAEYGARSIKHEIERQVINEIAHAHERGFIDNYDDVMLCVDLENDSSDIILKINNSSEFSAGNYERTNLEVIENLNEILQNVQKNGFFFKSIIGIDFGAASSCVAVVEKYKVIMVPNSENEIFTLSYVAFDGKNIIVGKKAKDYLSVDASNTVMLMKPLLGKKEFCEAKYKFAFAIFGDCRVITLNLDFGNECYETYYVQNITANIITYLKDSVIKKYNANITGAVIPVPFFFDVNQREATKDAVRLAGIDSVKLIHEPVAALIACLTANQIKKGTFLVICMGAASLEAAVIIARGNKLFVRSAANDTMLGGFNFDLCLANYFMTKIKSDYYNKYNFSLDMYDELCTASFTKLRLDCEKAKIALTESYETQLVIKFETSKETFNYEINLTRDKFEKICQKLFDRLFEPVEKTLRETYNTKDSFDKILLLGESTRIPRVNELFRKYFQFCTLDYSVKLRNSVVEGAAIYGSYLHQKWFLARMELLKNSADEDTKSCDCRTDEERLHYH